MGWGFYVVVLATGALGPASSRSRPVGLERGSAGSGLVPTLARAVGEAHGDSGAVHALIVRWGEAAEIRSDKGFDASRHGDAWSNVLARSVLDEEGVVTGKADFTEAEWAQVLEGPPSAGMLVMAAQRGGMLRESFAMAKAYTETRKQHGQSELIDEIVSARPKMDHTRYHSQDELRTACLGHLSEAVGVLEGNATAAEVVEYKQFVLDVVEQVAAAHREGGQSVSPAERDAIDQITQGLGRRAT
jgi:hypothetical protein